MDPLVRWAGGKKWFLPIFNHLVRNTPYDTLVELFAGGLAISLGRQEKHVIAGDINPHLINFYRELQSGTSMYVVDALPEDGSPVTVEIYNAIREQFNNGNLTSAQRAQYFFFLNKHCFNGLYRENKQGKFNVPWNKREWVGYPAFAPYTKLIENWCFLVGDWRNDCVDNIEAIVENEKALIFADPPYDDGFTAYSKEGFNWGHQLTLAQRLSLHDGPVVATNLATPRILELYRDLGYNVLTVDAPRRISCDGNRSPVKEMVATRNLVAG